jgi:hypothetical protein
MANLTDPLIKSLQGTDPQNLMEYITRQKISDSRFWKEECFGLTAADVLERAAKSLSCIGSSYGANRKPTKFLCLTLKLLQLQPDQELVETFIKQDHFKYVKALGAFYLRLTGRPHDIYELLEPCYQEYSKLKYRDVNEWRLVHMDEFIDGLLTQPFACGIALPRLPKRETLEDAGYLEEGPRLTALKDRFDAAGGLKEYLKLKADSGDTNAEALWERRYGKLVSSRTMKNVGKIAVEKDNEERITVASQSEKRNGETRSESDGREKKRKKTKKDTFGGTLFKKSKTTANGSDKNVAVKGGSDTVNGSCKEPPTEEGSEEYWNAQREKLGLKPLK